MPNIEDMEGPKLVCLFVQVCRLPFSMINQTPIWLTFHFSLAKRTDTYHAVILVDAVTKEIGRGFEDLGILVRQMGKDF